MDDGWRKMLLILSFSILMMIVLLLAQSPHSATPVKVPSIARLLPASNSDDEGLNQDGSTNGEHENPILSGDSSLWFDPDKKPKKGILSSGAGKQKLSSDKKVHFSPTTKFSQDTVDGLIARKIYYQMQLKSYWTAKMCPTFKDYAKKKIQEVTVQYLNSLAQRRNNEIQQNSELKTFYDTAKESSKLIDTLHLQWGWNYKKELNRIVETVTQKMSESSYEFFEVSQDYDVKLGELSRLKVIELIEEVLSNEVSKVNDMVDQIWLLFEGRIQVRIALPMTKDFWNYKDWDKSSPGRKLKKSIQISKMAIINLMRELGNPRIDEQLIVLMKQALQQRIKSDETFGLLNLQGLKKGKNIGSVDKSSERGLRRESRPTQNKGLSEGWTTIPQVKGILQKINTNIARNQQLGCFVRRLDEQEPERIKRIRQQFRRAQEEERKLKVAIENNRMRESNKKDKQKKKGAAGDLKKVKDEAKEKEDQGKDNEDEGKNKEDEMRRGIKPEKEGQRARLQQKKRKQNQQKTATPKSQKKEKDEKEETTYSWPMPKGFDDPDKEEDQILYRLP